MIRAPHIPKSENPAITLSNQKRQIDMLLARVEQLTAQVDTYAHDCRKAEDLIDKLNIEIRDLRSSYARHQGWQACATDFFRLVVGK